MIVLSGIVQIVNIGMTVFTDTTERRRRETARVAEAIAPPVGHEHGGRRDATAPEEDERIPRGWARHPRERMLITPWLAGIGGLLAFFTVVAIVVWLPIHTFDPPPSGDWTPLSNQAVAGRKIFAQNGCYVCHSGYSRPQDVRNALYFLYPKISEPGDFWGSDQSPNLLGTERTGPDLSQEGGWHPDDWQRAHFYDPRYVDPLSLMPSMKSLFSDRQVEELISFVQMRSGKSGLLRYAGQLYSKHVVLTNQGFKPAPTGFQAAHAQIAEGADREAPKGQLEEAPNLAQIDRGYWLSGDPLPVTEGNLMRGKKVFLERCVACHGLAGDGKGPGREVHDAGARRLHDKDDACCGGDTGPGDFYYRILRGWPGNGHGELRRPPLGRRHLAGRPLHQDDPEPHAGPGCRAGAEGLHHLAAVAGAARLAEDDAEAHR